MIKYHLSNQALLDLENIWDYTVKEWSESQAEFYYNQIIKTCSELAKNPSVGKSYSEVKLELLGYKTGKHIVFYKGIKNNEIIVFRILHELMDLESRLVE